MRLSSATGSHKSGQILQSPVPTNNLSIPQQRQTSKPNLNQSSLDDTIDDVIKSINRLAHEVARELAAYLVPIITEEVHKANTKSDAQQPQILQQSN